MIKKSKVTFQDTNSSNVTANPSPNHTDLKINAIFEEKGFVVERDVRKVSDRSQSVARGGE